MKIKLQPFSTPNFVIQQMPSRPRQDAPSYQLSEVDAEVLAAMCDAFRAEVFRKTGKPDPGLSTSPQEEWRQITAPDRGLFLVTNNFKARNAHGDMSHVWLTHRIHVGQEIGDGRFFTICDSGRIVGLTHYMRVSPALAALPAPQEKNR